MVRRLAMSKVDFSDSQVGPYFFTRPLGVGASGTVYHAVDTTSKYHRAFAVKCISRVNIPKKRGARLVSEISFLNTTADCPNVVSLRDMMDEHQHLFLVFDLCDSDLHDAIADRKYWANDSRIRKTFIQILDAVIACHDRGVFHRDLKPSNIMCNKRGGGIRLGDFGLATHQTVSRDGGCGTRQYMSPECLLSRRGDPYETVPADTWSLGVILFTMVTGSHAWEEATPFDAGFKAFLNDEDHLFRMTPISEELSTMLKWILHPDPGCRLPLRLIRRMMMDMRTFYKWRPPQCDAVAAAERAIADYERTCVELAAHFDDKVNIKKSAIPTPSSDPRRQKH